MVQSSPASRNPADNFSLGGMLSVYLKKHMQSVDDMLPAQVVSYNRTTNRARVQPIISMITTDSTLVPRAAIASIPVFQYGGGGFAITFPLVAGDMGWIKANDRDISLFNQSGANSPPNTNRTHSFENAMFFPDIMNKITLAEEDINNFVVQNLLGTVKIALWENFIKILSPMGIGINGTPNPNLAVDIQSTTQAFAMPRMSTAQKIAIPSPQEGFMVYDLNLHRISTYSSGAWV